MNLLFLIVSIQLLFQEILTIKASAKIIKYDPLSLELRFTQKVVLPSFQILVDDTNLPYKVLNNDSESDLYQIQVLQNYRNFDADNSEAFSIVFNYPLDAANGELFLSNYFIKPETTGLFITLSTWPVYFILILLYVSSLFSIISLSVIDFIQIFVLTGMKFPNQTIIVETYSFLFFFGRPNTSINQIKYLESLIKPTIFVIGFFTIGVIIKVLAGFVKNNFIKKKMVKFFAYDLFLSAWVVLLPAIIFKAFSFVRDFSTNIQLQFTDYQYLVGIVFTHINFVNFGAFFYVLYFVINPKINQNNSEFMEYLMSRQFQLYSKFHNGLYLSQFVKRNTMLFLCVRKLIIVILFFTTSDISISVLALQMITCFYIFTVRPYKEWYNKNIFLVFNIIWFFFFIMVVEGNLYFSISNILITRTSLTNFLRAKYIIFHIVCFLGVIASAFDGYLILRNVKYDFKQEGEVNQKSDQIRAKRKRLLTETSEKFITELKDSLIFQNFSSLDRKKIRSSSNASNHKVDLFELQMQGFSPIIANRKLSTKIKKKWKDKSLLAQLADTS